MSGSLTCSVVINTYNRAAYLRRLLPGLAHLKDASFEIIVVSGPSTDETPALLEPWRGRIKLLDCPKPNLSLSRNIGIQGAAGDVVVFIDDDALPIDARWLSRFVQAFESDATGRVAAVGGPVLSGDTEAREFNGGATDAYGFQLFDLSSVNPAALDKQRWTIRVQGCNAAFLRSALLKIGGFDEFFTYYHDETDVCLRLVRAGYEVRLLTDNAVRHYPIRSTHPKSFLKHHWRAIARSDTYYALKNAPDSLPRRIFKTLRASPRKHFFVEINQYLLRGDASFPEWLRLMGQWLSGFTSGFRAGLFAARQTRAFAAPAEPFLPFQSPNGGTPLCIALLTQTVPGQPGCGGIGRYTFDLARGLHERGHEVHVICKGERRLHHESTGFLVHGIPASEWTGQALFADKPILNKNTAYALAVARKVQELHAAGSEIEVVHATNWDAEGAAVVRSRFYPTVLMLVTSLAQDIACMEWKLTDDLRACMELDRWQIANAEVVCAPSEGVLKSYEVMMRLPVELSRRIRATPLGIVPALLPAVGPTPGRRRLLYAGRCERRKGVQVLFEALPGLLADFPEWECHIVGDDRQRLEDGTTLKERFLEPHRNAPWLDRVVFHGEVTEKDLLAHYRGCDLFVAPSLFESFGLIYHEAMQFGKAVVGCRAGGVPEVVQDGVEGLLVTPGDAPELEAALRKLMADDALRLRMGQAGARRVHERTNYRTMARDLEACYREAIARAGEDCRARRKRSYPRDLPLFATSAQVRFDAHWTTREAVPGRLHRMGPAGAMIQVEAEGGSTLRLIGLRHPWSGVLDVRVNGTLLGHKDFYCREFVLGGHVDLPLPGNPGKPVTVDLRVNAERNPESRASDVWLERIVVIPGSDMPLDEAMRPQNG